MPKLCEKCGHYDPATLLTADSRCPSCGLVYASLPPPTEPPEPVPASPDTAATSLEMDALTADWPAPKPLELWSAVAAACVLFALVFFDDDGFVMLLDHANLAFHEAGHVFFGVLGSTLALYGGTLGQLVFPVVVAVKFWRQRHAVGVALSGVWLFENLLNIARYMADARAQRLPLVGGGEHDWYHIFSRWGLLDSDTAVASVTQAIGWLGMIGCLVWLWRRFTCNRG